MPASFRKIDYSIRPAKHAERKMLLEIFRRLAIFGPLADYRYVGLGSVWFSDFQLFHRSLGIAEMVSIEREATAERRIRANIPFAAIQPVFKTTSDAIPELSWNKRQIVWLDYDDSLAPTMLADAAAIAARVPSGSVIALSLQHHHAREIDEAREAGGSAKALFQARYARDLLPGDFEEDDLFSRRFARLSREMIHSQIENALVARNSGVDHDINPDEVLHYRRVCDIEYSDDAPMTTTIGIVVRGGEMGRLEHLDLTRLDFYKGTEAVRIRVPKITPREARFLEQQLPRGEGFDPGQIPEADAGAFSDFYRYLPMFSPVEI